MRKVFLLLGIASLIAGLFMLFLSKPWDKSLLWISLGVLVLMEYKDHKSIGPH